ncbi:G2/mitotic-specific cyclin-B [Bactrocera neohumeralis]|uniref:G2/mitotic-specific cyclin-B n=1 Tax=Bactrocera neohumeralis TaxID=98809 RepID=UPI0021660A09|nr:G2/mitotic-specific cyclin-B [Bactrocera neohumeralis]
MVGATKIRIDENETNTFAKVKKFGVANATENTKRAALGDLQNRAVLRLANAKEAAQKDIDSKLKNVIQNTKPRVDTHWKKAPGATVKSTSTAAEQPKKILTRSNSTRVEPAALQRNAVTGLNKHKTLTTKVVEQKLQQAKLIKAKTAQDEKPKKSGEALTLRREDSNLSLKSLSKLKAALTREANKVTAGKLIAQSVKPETKAVSESSDSDSESNKNAVAQISSAQTYSPEVEDFADIEDIDSGDSDQLLLVSEYVNDIYNYLFQLEEEQVIQENHLDDQVEVYPKMRAVLIDWINEVHFQFHLTPETFQMTVAIIDRYLQEVKDTKRTHLQLVGVTALFIAAKYEELVPPSIADFVYITDDTYNSKQIVQMELKIIKTLECNLSRPLPIHFLRRFSKAAKVEDIHHALAKYFLELTSIEYDLASYKPSEIAAASLFLALHLLKENAKAPTGFNNKHWSPTMQYYSRYTAEHLRPIATKIATVVRNAPSAKLKAVYTKYQSSKLYKIAMRSELYDKLIDSIINHTE